MNLSELRTFLAIVETGSLVRASQVLNVTQSTVTARLKALEDELGQTLITRNKSGARLTAAGDRLHRYADTISELWRQARQEAALPTAMSGICNMACEPDLWPALAARLVADLTRTQPDLAISVWMGSAAEVTGWLRDGRADLALSTTPDTGPGQTARHLPPDRLVLVSPVADTPVRGSGRYVYIEAGEDFGRAHAAAYADADTARITFSNATMGHAHLLASGGSAYLPRRMVAADLAAGRLHLLAGAPVFARPVYLKVSDAARARWGWFDAAVARLVQGTQDAADQGAGRALSSP